MRTNRGLSTVVATVLLILLTVAAAGLILQFVVPFARDILFKAECTKYRGYFQFEDDFGFICTNGTSHGVTIKSNSDNNLAEKVIGFDLLFVTNLTTSKTISLRLGQNADESFKMLNASKTKISIPTSGDIQTFVYYEKADYIRVSVFPVIRKGDGDELVCEESGKISLKSCFPLNKLTVI